jgi:hypothetical protein
MSLSDLLAILCVTFDDALAIVCGDIWFSNKTNKSHPRFINLATGEKSNTDAPGFTQVDIDAMNVISDRSKLTPEVLAKNTGLLAAFIFSTKMNIAVLRKFCEIITYIRCNDMHVESISAIRKIFIAHLAWALANIGDKPSWDNITYDPLINAILKANASLLLPRFEDATHDDSLYFAVFEKVATTTTDSSISDGLRMDANRFDLYLATMN